MQVIKTFFIEAIKNISAFLKGKNISLNGKGEKKKDIQRKFGTNIQCEFLSKHRKTPLLKLFFCVCTNQPTMETPIHS